MKLKLGHVHLKVRNLARSLNFYRNRLSFAVTEIVGGKYAFLTLGGMHHHLALQEVGASAPLASPFVTGLYHVAFELEDEESFANAYEQLQTDGVTVSLADHGISWAMYFADPDGNGLELYCDRRASAGGTALWHGMNAALDMMDVQSELV